VGRHRPGAETWPWTAMSAAAWISTGRVRRAELAAELDEGLPKCIATRCRPVTVGCARAAVAAHFALLRRRRAALRARGSDAAARLSPGWPAIGVAGVLGHVPGLSALGGRCGGRCVAGSPVTLAPGTYS